MHFDVKIFFMEKIMDDWCNSSIKIRNKRNFIRIRKEREPLLFEQIHKTNGNQQSYHLTPSSETWKLFEDEQLICTFVKAIRYSRLKAEWIRILFQMVKEKKILLDILYEALKSIFICLFATSIF